MVLLDIILSALYNFGRSKSLKKYEFKQWQTAPHTLVILGPILVMVLSQV